MLLLGLVLGLAAAGLLASRRPPLPVPIELGTEPPARDAAG